MASQPLFEAQEPMAPAVFERFRRIVYDRSGITLHDGKAALVAARVGKRMRVLGMRNHAQYLEHVLADETGEEITLLLDAISTNVTSFFRESAHFDLLRQTLREAYDGGQRRFRLWSAASSSGEEPYTMALTAVDSLGPDADLKILATDISTRVLAKAREATYPADRVAPVPAPLRERWFETVAGPEGKAYRVKRELRALVTFGRMNLAEPPYPMKGPFDVVFCRNVMIYFDSAVRTKVVGQIERLLKPGGLLMVGHAESLTGLSTGLRVVRPAVYRKP